MTNLFQNKIFFKQISIQIYENIHLQKKNETTPFLCAKYYSSSKNPSFL